MYFTENDINCTVISMVHDIVHVLFNCTFHPQPVPENIVVIAACNPHRGNSMAAHKVKRQSWLRGNYYVGKLHPTLEYLKWDYGSLSSDDERKYIQAKIDMQISEQVIEVSHLDTQLL